MSSIGSSTLNVLGALPATKEAVNGGRPSPLRRGPCPRHRRRRVCACSSWPSTGKIGTSAGFLRESRRRGRTRARLDLWLGLPWSARSWGLDGSEDARGVPGKTLCYRPSPLHRGSGPCRRQLQSPDLCRPPARPRLRGRSICSLAFFRSHFRKGFPVPARSHSRSATAAGSAAC
jgi:hypothetical protein